MFERYEALPDYMKPGEVVKKITEFLAEVRTTNVDIKDASDSLVELAERQWHTYEYLDTTLKDQVDNWVALTWNNLNLSATHGLPDWWAKERLSIVEGLTSAIGLLGLSQSYQTVQNSLSDEMHPDIKSEIQETIAEFGDTVDDPYRGLKKPMNMNDH